MKSNRRVRILGLALVLLASLITAGDVGAAYPYDCAQVGCDECWQGRCVISLGNGNCTCRERSYGCVAWGRCLYWY